VPFTGQHCVLQDWEEGPEQPAPPLEGGGFVQARVCVPPPQDAEQDDQALQPPSTGHGCALQDWEEGPEQLVPPQEGVGFVQARVCVPPPQDAEQDDQALQPPSTETLVPPVHKPSEQADPVKQLFPLEHDMPFELHEPQPEPSSAQVSQPIQSPLPHACRERGVQTGGASDMQSHCSTPQVPGRLVAGSLH
jgi:hypothetical protein